MNRLDLTVASPAEARRARATHSRARALGWSCVILLLALAPLALLMTSAFWVNILIYTYLFAGLAVAWNMLAGFCGQFSLGHGVFFAVGAYMTAQLYLIWGISPWLGMLPGAAVSAVIGALIFWPTFRLKGAFFAIATLAFNQVGLVLTNYFDALTGGSQGLQIPYRPGLANMIFVQPQAYALLMFGFMAVCVLAATVLRHSRLGYYLLAVRDDEQAAGALGIGITQVKLYGTALSAALVAIGGSLFAMYVRTLDAPSIFSLSDVGVRFALITLIGGIGTTAGPLLGAFVIVPLESWLRSTLGGAWPGAHLIVLGAIMLLASLFMRRGVIGVIAYLAARRNRGPQ